MDDIAVTVAQRVEFDHFLFVVSLEQGQMAVSYIPPQASSEGMPLSLSYIISLDFKIFYQMFEDGNIKIFDEQESKWNIFFNYLV